MGKKKNQVANSTPNAAPCTISNQPVCGFNGKAAPALWERGARGDGFLWGWDVREGTGGSTGGTRRARPEPEPEPGVGWTGREGFGTHNPAHKELLYGPWNRRSWVSHTRRRKYPPLPALVWERYGVQLKCTAHFTVKTLRKGTGKKKINTQMI